jgi:putative acetyltransferase
MALVIEQVDAPTDVARALVDELEAELSASYVAEQRHGLGIAHLFEPGVVFFIGRLDDEPVGCGGLAVEDGVAEVKRMYVRPRARGRDVAQRILARLEDEARARGATRLVLETGDVQHAALRFYGRAGFTRCAAFGRYATMPRRAIERSVFLEKSIARSG